ncbi:MAG: nuclear transport factor 2 family protein [Bacteroidales bacterium]
MKVFICLFFFGIMFWSCQRESTGPVAFNAQVEREKVSFVLEKYVIANEDQKIEIIREIWAPFPDIVVIGTDLGEKLVGWPTIKRAYERQFKSFEETLISVHDQVIRINETGNTAWFSQILNYNYIYQGKKYQHEGLRFTGVLVKHEGDWVMVQSHISKPGIPD